MMALQHDSPAAAHWSRQQYEVLIIATSADRRSEHVAWIAEEESMASGVLAFLVAHRIDTEWELENIAVAAAVRRRGVGARLLSEFIAHARAERGSEIFLEVRESNQSARAFYRKAGFEETGLRKGYYSSPAENAIVCRLRLN
jgi:ribosomal-protein-alanine N-acetyltransferase